eukprot:2900309-Prorocentrum_lima.AAC.1
MLANGAAQTTYTMLPLSPHSRTAWGHNCQCVQNPPGPGLWEACSGQLLAAVRQVLALSPGRVRAA